MPSDEFAYRNFFYSLQEETIYYRFFSRIRIFSHEVLQKHWASVDYRKNMTIIGLVKKGGHKEIVAIASYAQEDDQTAEVAFVVSESYHNMGIASYLLKTLEKIAKENNYKKFTATVLRENPSMLHVFKKRYPNARTSVGGGNEIMIEMNLDDGRTQNGAS